VSNVYKLVFCWVYCIAFALLGVALEWVANQQWVAGCTGGAKFATEHCPPSHWLWQLRHQHTPTFAPNATLQAWPQGKAAFAPLAPHWQQHPLGRGAGGLSQPWQLPRPWSTPQAGGVQPWLAPPAPH